MMPGTVCPLGEVPMTVPADAALFCMLTLSATWNPERATLLARCPDSGR